MPWPGAWIERIFYFSMGREALENEDERRYVLVFANCGAIARDQTKRKDPDGGTPDYGSTSDDLKCFHFFKRQKSCFSSVSGTIRSDKSHGIMEIRDLE